MVSHLGKKFGYIGGGNMKLDKALELAHKPYDKYQVNNSDKLYQETVLALATLAAYCEMFIVDRERIERSI
jgi:hypothetical protein